MGIWLGQAIIREWKKRLVYSGLKIRYNIRLGSSTIPVRYLAFDALASWRAANEAQHMPVG